MRKFSAQRRTTRKRSFLLFELLVSLTLIAMCILPLIKPHVAMQKKRLESLFAVQYEAFNQEAFCRFKKMLYENQGPSFEQLVKGCKGDIEGTFTLYTGKESFRKVACHYEVTKIDTSNKTSKRIKALVMRVDLTFNPPLLWDKKEKVFKHTLYVEQSKETTA